MIKPSCLIELRGKYGNGKFAIVDGENYEVLNKWKWCVEHGYAIRTINKPYKKVFMHRVINNTPEGFETDHINGDRLDNRRINLRTVNHQQNTWNSKKCIDGLCQYKGVDFKKDHKKYRASVILNGRHIHIGYFETEEEAALAYNKSAYKLFGEYANLNKIGGGVGI